MQDNDLSPAEKAHRTGKWAKTMTKWLMTYTSKGSKPWQIVSFEGPKGRESRGIVDLLAIRKDHREPKDEPLKAGDLFEIILIQVKGGGSGDPTKDDIKRLREVAKRYDARDIILAVWKKGKAPSLRRLEDSPWKDVEPEEVFG